MASQTYHAPRLTSDALVSYLKVGFGSDMNYAAVLQDHSWQNLAPLWERVVEQTFKVAREYLKRPTYAAIPSLHHAELHDDAIYMRALFIKTRKVAKMAGVEKFSIKDLCEPSLERLNEILSCMVNLQNFLIERKHERTAQTQGVVEVKELLAAELQRKAQLVSELQAMKDKEATEQTEADKLLAQAAERKQASNEEAKQTNMVRQELESTQHKINDYLQRMEQVKAKIQVLRLRKDELKNSQLPESPSKVQEKLQQQEQDITNMTQCLNESEAKRRQQRQRLHDWNSLHERVQATVQRMEMTKVRVVAKKQERKQLKQLMGSIAQLQQQGNELQLHLKQLQIKHSAVLAKKDKLVSEAQAEVQLAEQEVESQRGAREVQQRRLRTKQTKIAELNKQVAALQQQMADVEAQCEAEERSLQSAMDAVREDILAVKAAIENAFHLGAASLPHHAFPHGVNPARGVLGDVTNTTLDHTADLSTKLTAH